MNKRDLGKLDNLLIRLTAEFSDERRGFTTISRGEARAVVAAIRAIKTNGTSRPSTKGQDTKDHIMTKQSAEEIVAELRRDVFYGDERAARFGQHNPLHMRAADEIERQKADKDAAYLERNRLVALLARLFPSGVARTEIPGWLPEWHGCVYIDLPTGQASWHYHDGHAHLFSDLPPYTKPWDGHTTDEKYQRVFALTTSGYSIEQGWRTIDSAPRDGTSFLLRTRDGRMYCGRWRSGSMGEPQADVIAWRCDSSGRFSNPTHFRPLPAAPGGTDGNT